MNYTAEQLRAVAEYLTRSIPLGYGYARVPREHSVAAHACDTLAAQMESAGQGFEEWFKRYVEECPGVADWPWRQMEDAYQAATAASAARIAELETDLDKLSNSHETAYENGFAAARKSLEKAERRIAELESQVDDAILHVVCDEEAEHDAR